ncbi:Tetraspanin-5 [Ananas comosus]|uniref:Tetraspanin-5 n=1 Tax=Ananas comosus TaxID=4615 RepID=A0A199VYA8_ANACO|nr:Tetraspanin-5 [Ananas comosus]
MYGGGLSNATIGYVNAATLLGSIPLIGWGLWLARGSSSSASPSCSSFLQAPVLGLGLALLLVSLAGLVGACSASTAALRLYLAALLLLLAALLAAAALGLAVSGPGGGSPLPGRAYREYRLSDYSPWLRRRLADPSVWRAALACAAAPRACAEIASWTPADYLRGDLTPVQSGCCKPPTACAYSGGAAVAGQEEDCYRWSNAASVLCYGCDSCKAGVLEQVRRGWHKLALLNVVAIVLLVILYSLACCALRNVRRAKYAAFPYAAAHPMAKALPPPPPRWDSYWDPNFFM